MNPLGWCLAATLLILLLIVAGYGLTLLHILDRHTGTYRVNLAPEESEETKESD